MGDTNNSPTRVFCSVRMASGFRSREILGCPWVSTTIDSSAPPETGTGLDVGFNLECFLLGRCENSRRSGKNCGSSSRGTQQQQLSESKRVEPG